jgi:XTP/dITP diphosphohydrolase
VKRLLVATRNAGKLRELKVLLVGALDDLALESLDDHPSVSDVEETGDTFEANARQKASHAARASGLWALAEDSGLEVDSLGGAPGVRSARYAGVQGDDRANLQKLLRELDGKTERRARFVCVAALARPDGAIAATSSGSCEGEIALAPRGSGGFGYDPVFLPAAYGQRTMAELTPGAKAEISHRGQALRALIPLLRAHL